MWVLQKASKNTSRIEITEKREHSRRYWLSEAQQQILSGSIIFYKPFCFSASTSLKSNLEFDRRDAFVIPFDDEFRFSFEFSRKQAFRPQFHLRSSTSHELKSSALMTIRSLGESRSFTATTSSWKINCIKRPSQRHYENSSSGK